MKISGIYLIFNRINKKCYVGSSIDIASRFRKHRNLLKHGKHDNQHLQNAWNKYSEASFKFSLLERTTEDKLLVREQFWMDKLQDKYNIIPKAGNTKGFKHCLATRKRLSFLASQKTGTKNIWFGKRLPEHVIEACRKVTSKKFKGEGNPFWGKKHSQETREHLSKVLTGRKMSQTFLDKQNGNERGAKEYLITFPDGKKLIVKNLKKFCRDNHFPETAGSAALFHNRLYKGFKFQHLRDVDR